MQRNGRVNAKLHPPNSLSQCVVRTLLHTCMSRSIFVICLMFAIENIYTGWFWRNARAEGYWLFYIVIHIAKTAAWWYLLRHASYSVLKASALADVCALLTWYAPLVIWKEALVTWPQIVGFLLFVAGIVVINYA